MYQWRLRSPRQVSISLWNIARALVSLKGILSHSQKPSGPTVNAVNGLLSSSILTCQYPDFRSREENHWEPCKLSSVLSIWGSEYASLMVQLFSFLRLIQNPRLLSFFWTRTTALAHGLCDFWIAPISSTSWMSALTSSWMWEGIHQ